MATAKLIPFPRPETPPPAPAPAPKREALTWKLIKTTLASPPPKGAPHRYLTDPSMSGFGVYITSAAIGAYYVECKEKQADGNWKRVRVAGWLSVGRHERDRDGKAELVQARRLAGELLEKAARGEAISKAAIAATNRLTRTSTGTAFTYRVAFKAYLEKTGRKGKPLRPATIEDYEKRFASLAEWHDLVLWTITKKMASDEMVRLQRERGPIAANLALSLFRSVWEWHAADLPDPLPCPTASFSKKNLWTSTKRREGKIDEELTPAWWAAVHSMVATINYRKNSWWQPVDRLYFVALLLTGARRNELLHSPWRHYNAERSEWFFPGTDADRWDEKARQWKSNGRRYVGNKSDRDHMVYVGPVLAQLLLEHRSTQGPDCKYIFATRADRLLSEDRADYAIAQFRKVNPKMKRWSCHTLRHTFLTVAYELGVGLKEMKLLVNHEASNSDVTLGYIHPEKLRAHGAAIEAEILRRAGVN